MILHNHLSFINHAHCQFILYTSFSFKVCFSPLQPIPDIRHPSDTPFPDSSGKFHHNRDHLHISAPNENEDEDINGTNRNGEKT